MTTKNHVWNHNILKLVLFLFPSKSRINVKLLFLVTFIAFCSKSFATDSKNIFDSIFNVSEGKTAFEDFFRPKPKPNSPLIFIALPKELKSKNLVQTHCDCHTGSNEFFAGEFSLTHAIDDAVIFADYPLKTSAQKLIRSTYKDLKLAHDKNTLDNFKKVAEALKLDALHLAYENNMLVSVFYRSSIMPWLMAVGELGQIHDMWLAGRSFYKPIFFYVDKKVVLFSLVSDGDTINIILNDSTNKPIKHGSSLFNAAQFISGYFLENEYLFMKELARIFAKSPTPHLREIERQASFDDQTAKDDSYELLKRLFDEWLVEADQLHELNKPLKLLKRLFRVGHSDMVKNIIIRIYDAMLSSIEKNGNHEATQKVVDAMVNSITEQKIFTLTESSAVLARAEKMLKKSSY